MGPGHLLDTNICIYLRQNRPPEAAECFRRLQLGEAALSVITYGELTYGAERSEQRALALESLARLASLLAVLPLPEITGIVYGEIRGRLEVQRQMIAGDPREHTGQ
jgi:tRNA(fMet)-specific endonuclease VapC